MDGASPEDGDLFGASLAAIDADGSANNVFHKEIVIGTPNEAIENISEAGIIHYVKPPTHIGSTLQSSTVFHQDTPGTYGTAEPQDKYGFALAVGDFNQGGEQDLAIGVPGEDVNGKSSAGAVNILRGKSSTVTPRFPGGLDTPWDQIWTQGSIAIRGIPNDDERFGHALASGDFDGDDAYDLAIGVPGDVVDGILGAGSVNVLYGVFGNGLSSGTGYGIFNQIWNQNTDGIKGGSESYDNFGNALATGDFNGDGYDDLAIGIPFEDIDGISNAGAVQVLYSAIDEGLTDSDQFISQDEPGFIGASEPQDYFGYSLAVGDLNDDGYEDLAIGAIGEDIGDVINTGAVYVVYGSSSGLQYGDEDLITQAMFHTPGGLQSGRSFGWALTISDLDGDGKDDLAISTDIASIFVSPTNPNSVTVAYQKDHDNIYKSSFE